MKAKTNDAARLELDEETFLGGGAPPLARTRQAATVVVIIPFVSLALNQSAEVFGLNLSLADALVAIALLLLLLVRGAALPTNVSTFFALVVAVGVATASFVTPMRFGTAPVSGSTLADVLKMATSLAFVTVGYSIARLGLGALAVRWFAIGAAIIAGVGSMLDLFGVRVLDGLIRYGGIRFRGLMIDPNYYAVLAVAATVYFIRDRQTAFAVRLAAIGALTFSIIISGSRTGLVTLLVVALAMLLEYSFVRRRSLPLAALTIACGVATIAYWQAIRSQVDQLAERYGSTLPQLTRLSEVFRGDLGADLGGPTSRISVWSDAVDIIQASPLVGVGIGAYSSVNEVFSGRETLAHNTYLQITAEWGVPLSLAFFGWLALLVLRLTRKSPVTRNADLVILRDIIVVFLMGSMALSLNNARMFWFFLGMAVFEIASDPNRRVLRLERRAKAPRMES